MAEELAQPKFKFGQLVEVTVAPEGEHPLRFKIGCIHYLHEQYSYSDELSSSMDYPESHLRGVLESREWVVRFDARTESFILLEGEVPTGSEKIKIQEVLK